MVYFTLAYPYVQYCISSWGGASHTTLQPLIVKQKMIIKTMLFKNYITPSSPLFYQLRILKLKEVYDLQIGKLMFKQVRNNNVICQNISSLSTVHSYNTRSSKSNYFIPTVHSNLGKTSFTYYGPIIWNSIPNQIKQLSQFKFLFKNIY